MEPGLRAVQTHYRHQLVEILARVFDLRSHRRSSLRRCLGGKNVALRQRLNLRDRLADAGDPQGLFAARGGDLAHQLGAAGDGGGDLLECRLRMTDQLHSFGHVGDRLLDDGAARARRLRRAVRQRTHFVRHYAESRARLARPSRLHSSERTSSATTLNPAPASPARAASTAAFNARILVWKAMSSMVFKTPATWWLDLAIRLIDEVSWFMACAARSTVWCADCIRRSASPARSAFWRVVAEISSSEAEVSSMQAACSCALADTSVPDFAICSAARPASPAASCTPPITRITGPVMARLMVRWTIAPATSSVPRNTARAKMFWLAELSSRAFNC